jgi:hypothetical protein
MYRFWRVYCETQQSQDVHRAGAGPNLVQAVGYRPGGELLRGPGRLERIVAVGEPGRQHRGVRATRPVGRTAVVALARELDQPVAVEEGVDGLLAMPAGDHHDPRAECVDLARELLGERRTRRP